MVCTPVPESVTLRAARLHVPPVRDGRERVLGAHLLRCALSTFPTGYRRLGRRARRAGRSPVARHPAFTATWSVALDATRDYHGCVTSDTGREDEAVKAAVESRTLLACPDGVVRRTVVLSWQDAGSGRSEASCWAGFPKAWKKPGEQMLAAHAKVRAARSGGMLGAHPFLQGLLVIEVDAHEAVTAILIRQSKSEGGFQFGSDPLDGDRLGDIEKGPSDYYVCTSYAGTRARASTARVLQLRPSRVSHPQGRGQ